MGLTADEEKELHDLLEQEAADVPHGHDQTSDDRTNASASDLASAGIAGLRRGALSLAGLDPGDLEGAFAAISHPHLPSENVLPDLDTAKRVAMQPMLELSQSPVHLLRALAHSVNPAAYDDAKDRATILQDYEEEPSAFNGALPPAALSQYAPGLGVAMPESGASGLGSGALDALSAASPDVGAIPAAGLRMLGKALPRDGIAGGLGDLAKGGLDKLALRLDPDPIPLTADMRKAQPPTPQAADVRAMLDEQMNEPVTPPQPGMSPAVYDAWKRENLTNEIPSKFMQELSPDKVERIQNNLRAGNAPEDIARAMGIGRDDVAAIARAGRYDAPVASATSSPTPDVADAASLLEDRTAATPPPVPQDAIDEHLAVVDPTRAEDFAAADRLRTQMRVTGPQETFDPPRSTPFVPGQGHGFHRGQAQFSGRFRPAEHPYLEPQRGYAPDELLRIEEEHGNPNAPANLRVLPDDPDAAAFARDRWARSLTEGEPDVDDAAARLALREQSMRGAGAVDDLFGDDEEPSNDTRRVNDANGQLRLRDDLAEPEEPAHGLVPERTGDIRPSTRALSSEQMSLQTPLDAEEDRLNAMRMTGVDPEDPQRMQDMGDYKRVGGGRGQSDDRGRLFETTNRMRGAGRAFEDAMQDSAPPDLITPPGRANPFGRAKPQSRPTMAAGEFPVDERSERVVPTGEPDALDVPSMERRAHHIYRATLSDDQATREQVLGDLQPDDAPAIIHAMLLAASDGRDGGTMSRIHYWMPDNGTREAMLAHLGYTNPPPSQLRANELINRHVMSDFMRQGSTPLNASVSAFHANGEAGLAAHGARLPTLADGTVIGLRAAQARHNALTEAAASPDPTAFDDLVQKLNGKDDPADVLRILGHTPRDESNVGVPFNHQAYYERLHAAPSAVDARNVVNGMSTADAEALVDRMMRENAIPEDADGSARDILHRYIDAVEGGGNYDPPED